MRNFLERKRQISKISHDLGMYFATWKTANPKHQRMCVDVEGTSGNRPRSC